MTVLGGLSSQAFLRDYWQKRPLLIRQGLPGFRGFLSLPQLQDMAQREDVQSRLVIEREGQWQVRHGPLGSRDYRGLRHAHWSLLVQGIEQAHGAGRALLDMFNFIPYARLDDLMVSFAPQGGSVGPHLDSYDVFLLQAGGHKHWQISAQTDVGLIEDAPLRLLKNFRAEQEWILGPGDILYLPPRYAHYGVALNDNYTYSIGFRAPSHQELAQQFLTYLQDKLDLPGRYADADLKHSKHPAEIGRAMVEKVAAVLESATWTRADIARFLGCYLSEPKPHVVLETPRKRLSQAKFKDAVRTRGVRLGLKSQMLFQGGEFFINGEILKVAAPLRALFRDLADTRGLPPMHHAQRWPEAALDIFYEWYCAAYLELG